MDDDRYETRAVDGYCAKCGDRVPLLLHRAAAGSDANFLTFNGKCQTMHHEPRPLDARGYWVNSASG